MKTFATRSHRLAATRSEEWLQTHLLIAAPAVVFEAGCGDGHRYAWLQYTKWCKVHVGCDINPTFSFDAKVHGIQYDLLDLNEHFWPYKPNTFDCVLANQVIEHLDSCVNFFLEARRILRPGGTMLLATENLTSFSNLAAMIVGFTPFSLCNVEGYTCGNPLSLHYKSSQHRSTGHTRVLGVRQCRELLKYCGFENIGIRTFGVPPLPDLLSRCVDWAFPKRGHFMNIFAQKPT